MLNETIYKQPLVLFLGAGASAPLGMKTTVQFINWVSSRDNIDLDLLYGIIKNVEPSKEVGKAPDIEAVLDYLEKLVEAGELFRKLGDLKTLEQLEKEKRERDNSITARPYPSVTSLATNVKLRDQIEDLVVEHYSEMEVNKAYSHYGPLYAGFSINRLPIFTTNYDLSVEKFYEHPKVRVRLIDGFKKDKLTIPHWSDEVYQDYVPQEEGKDIILFKLHGSVDWFKTPGGDIQRTEAKQRDPGSLKTVLVYPTRTKREIHEEPFRTNYDYLLACLAHARVCFVVGFSFRDQEIVEHFREAAGLNKDLRVVIFDTEERAVEGISTKLKLARPPEIIKIPSEAAENNIRFVARHIKEEVSKLIDS